jgi:hypothetical protein
VIRASGRAVAVLAAAVVAGVALSSTGGCTVGTDPREPASTKVKEVLDSGEGRFDLTRPPSREEAGLPAGRTVVTYQREDHKPFTVRVALPEGKELVVDAELVTFDSFFGPDPDTAPPSSMDIHHYAASLDAGREHLLAAARQFGYDTALIATWYAEATAPRPPQAPPAAQSPWLRSQVGYLRVAARRQPAVRPDRRALPADVGAVGARGHRRVRRADRHRAAPVL